MAGSVSASWEIPPYSWLNISDCDRIAPWMADLLVAMSDPDVRPSISKTYMGGTIPIQIVLDFLGALVPNNWTQPGTGDLLLWYKDFWTVFEVDNAAIFDDLFSFSLFECGSKVCPNLDFSGDSDLSGIGMMISYYMVAIFVTLYYLALVPGVLEASGHSFKSSRLVSRYRRFASGFEESISGFLDAMLLFSISMLVAAVTRYASLTLHPDEPHSLFGLQDCVFLSAFSVFPAFVLQSLSHDLRRRRIRLAFWDLIIVFTITIEVLYRLKYRNWVDHGYLAKDTARSQLSTMVWFIACQSEPLRESLQTMLSVGHGVMLANIAAWLYNVADIYAGKWWLPALQRRTRLWERWQRCIVWLRLGNGLLCLSVMWAFLGLFTAYRHDVMEKTGKADQDDEWTFGQVLSLTTWIPIGIELLFVYIYGAQESAEKNISPKYRVVHRADEEDSQNQGAYEKMPGAAYEKIPGAANEKAPDVEDNPLEAAHN